MYINAYNTIQYEVNALGSSTTALPPGTGVTITTLPTGIASPALYYVVAAATSTTQVDGVVSTRSAVINDKTPGRVVLLNAGLIPIKLNKDTAKDTIVKVTTSEGKFGEATTGTRSEAVTMEDGKADDVIWARPAKIDV